MVWEHFRSTCDNKEFYRLTSTASSAYQGSAGMIQGDLKRKHAGAIVASRKGKTLIRNMCIESFNLHSLISL